MKSSTKDTSAKSRPLLIIIIITLVLVAIAGAVIYSLGYRYIKTDYAKFSGLTKNGAPYEGSIRYIDGTKGTLTFDKKLASPVIKYQSGDIYTGDLLGIERHGKGKITYTSGDIYEGDFVHDERTGSALVTFADSSSYDGSVVNAKPHGTGKYTFSDGSYYYGEFNLGAKHGVGEYRMADGSYYRGTFVNDLKDGTEICNVPLADGKIYTGECMMYFADTGSTYVGDFKEDKRTGKGKYSFSSGEFYEGEFVNGLFDGLGTYHFASDNVSPYTGMFKDGKIVKEETSKSSEGSVTNEQ